MLQPQGQYIKTWPFALGLALAALLVPVMLGLMQTNMLGKLSDLFMMAFPSAKWPWYEMLPILFVEAIYLGGAVLWARARKWHSVFMGTTVGGAAMLLLTIGFFALFSMPM